MRTNAIAQLCLAPMAVPAIGTAPAAAVQIGETKMKRSNHRRTSGLCGLALLMGATAANAQETWTGGAELYFWGANLGGETTTGDDIDVSIDDIVKDLKFGAMGTIAGQRGPWGVFADLIYLDLTDSKTTNANVGGVSVPVLGDLELKGFISTFGVGYEVVETAATTISAIGGARYLWLDGNIGLNGAGLSVSEGESGNNWDGVVGFRGETELNEKWYLTYYADVGAGDSDLTWQALGAVNYRLGRVDLALGYRYLEFDFDDSGPFQSLNLSGAFAGVKIPF